MAKKRKGSKVAKHSVKALLRTKDISKEPSRKGGTSDGGIGSKCRRFLSPICKDSLALDTAKAAYKDVIEDVKRLPDDIARAVCLAACSDYTLESLIASAKTMTGSAALGERDLTRIATIRSEFGDVEADRFRRQLLWAKTHKKE